MGKGYALFSRLIDLDSGFQVGGRCFMKSQGYLWLREIGISVDWLLADFVNTSLEI